MRHADDAGETLVELVLAVLIMGTTGVVFVAGLFGVSLNGRLQQQRTIATALAAGAGETVRAARFVPCATPADYEVPGDVPDGFTVRVDAVDDWSGTAFATRSTTLSVAADATQTTVQVADPAALGSAAVPFQVVVATPTPELITVTAGSGPSTLTVARGDQRGTHPVGATVRRCDRLQRVTVTATGPDGTTASTVVAKPGTLQAATLEASAPAVADLGTAHLDETVVLAAALAPTGTLTVDLYGPAQFDPATRSCAAPPLATATTAVAGDGTYRVTVAPPGGFTTPGTYRWITSWSGDPANRAVTGACDAADQRTVVGSG